MASNKILQSLDFEEILEQKHLLPSVSLILSIDEFHTGNNQIEYMVATKLKSLDKELGQNFSKNVAISLMQKIEKLVSETSFKKEAKGLAIYCSLWYQKIFQLNFKPQEKILINDSFEIRDLVFNSTLKSTYLILNLSLKEFQIFEYDKKELIKIATDIPNRLEAYMQGTVTDVSIHHEKSDKKDKAIKIMIHQSKLALEEVTKSKQHSIIVLGDHKLVSFFTAQWHQNNILATKDGNYFEKTPHEISEVIDNLLEKIEIESPHAYDAKIELATNKHLLVEGVQEVWKAVVMNNVQCLIVEGNYRKPAILAPGGMEILNWEDQGSALPIVDVVDDIMEKTIASGGKIEFVMDGTLGKYERIIAIKRY